MMFSGSSSVDSIASGLAIGKVTLPSISSLNENQHEGSNKSLAKLSKSIELAAPVFDKNIPGLVTLSLLPKSQWQSLINLDIIKVHRPLFDLLSTFINRSLMQEIDPYHKLSLHLQRHCFCIFFQLRNKPTEPPKKPEKAPFFLTSVPTLGGEIVFKPTEPSKDGAPSDDEHRKNQRSFELPPSRFVQLLQSSAKSKNCKRPPFCT